MGLPGWLAHLALICILIVSLADRSHATEDNVAAQPGTVLQAAVDSGGAACLAQGACSGSQALPDEPQTPPQTPGGAAEGGVEDSQVPDQQSEPGTGRAVGSGSQEAPQQPGQPSGPDSGQPGSEADPAHSGEAAPVQVELLALAPEQPPHLDEPSPSPPAPAALPMPLVPEPMPPEPVPEAVPPAHAPEPAPSPLVPEPGQEPEASPPVPEPVPPPPPVPEPAPSPPPVLEPLPPPLPVTQPAPPPVPEPAPEPLPEEELRNFALIKDGAKVVQANKEAKKLSGLLDGDSDTYVKNECKADKWFIIELSQVAKISRVELSQYELYSSRVKSFEVRGRQSHPRVDGVELSKGLNSSQWKLLGALTAENKKGTQLFSLEHPAWARYLLVQIQSHYGSEAMCAINGFAAYGKSAAEEFEDHLASEETLQHLRSNLEEEVLVPVPEPAAIPAAMPSQPPQPAAPSAGPAEAKQDSEDSGTAAAEENATSQQLAAGTAAAAALDVGSTEAIAAPAKAAAAGCQQVSGSDAGSCCGEAGGLACTALPLLHTEQQPPDSGAVPVGEQTSTPSGGSDTTREGAAPQTAPPSAQAPSPLLAADQAAAPVPRDGDAAPAATAPADAADATADSAAPEQIPAQQESPPAPAFSSQQAPHVPAGNGQQAAAAGAQQQQQGAAAGDAADDAPMVLSWMPKAKGSTSVYDVLLQEIKTAKVQQKLASKTLVDLQRNMTTMHAELAADIVIIATQLAKVQKEANLSEEFGLSRLQSLVDARLKQLSQEVAALQQAAAVSATRQVAMLCLLSLLGAGIVLGMASSWRGAALVRWVAALLAIGNGLVGLLLQCRSSAGWGLAAVAGTAAAAE